MSRASVHCESLNAGSIHTHTPVVRSKKCRYCHCQKVARAESGVNPKRRATALRRGQTHARPTGPPAGTKLCLLQLQPQSEHKPQPLSSQLATHRKRVLSARPWRRKLWHRDVRQLSHAALIVTKRRNAGAAFSLRFSQS